MQLRGAGIGPEGDQTFALAVPWLAFDPDGGAEQKYQPGVSSRAARAAVKELARRTADLTLSQSSDPTLIETNSVQCRSTSSDALFYSLQNSSLNHYFMASTVLQSVSRHSGTLTEERNR